VSVCSLGAAAVTLYKCFQCEYNHASAAAVTMLVTSYA